MEKSMADSCETPNSSSSVQNFSIENLSLSVGNLSLTQGTIERSSWSRDGSLTRIQEIGFDSYPQYATGFKNSMPVLPPLPSHSIWADHNLSNTANFLGSIWEPWETSSMPPAFNSVNGYAINHDLNFCGGAANLMSQGGSEYCGNLLPNSVSDMQNQESVDTLEGFGFIRFAMSEVGSEKLLKVLMLNKPDLVKEIFERVNGSLNGISFIYYLMTDQYGCHIFTKLIDSCNQQQLAVIIYDITKDQNLFLKISLNKHGSSSIKKLIRVLKKSNLISHVINMLSTVFFSIMTDRIGSYVISESLGHLNGMQNKPLYEAAIKHCLDLAIHNQGCKSLQTFIDYIQGSHRHQLLDLISSNAVFLSQDPKGNYVVQKVLGLENPNFTDKICSLLRGHYATLSLQKGGSHVVEKCLNSQKMHYAVEDLLSNTNRLLQVARDQYGNFVIQAALKVTKQVGSPLYQRLLMSLQSHPNALQCGYGRNVFNLMVGGSGDSVQQA